MQPDDLGNEEDESLAMIAKGFKNMFWKHSEFKGIKKDHPQGEMNEIPKVSFSQRMMLIKILVIVVDFQVTWSRIVQIIKRKIRILDSNQREQIK